jgi:hypothetical protein
VRAGSGKRVAAAVGERIGDGEQGLRYLEASLPVIWRQRAGHPISDLVNELMTEL